MKCKICGDVLREESGVSQPAELERIASRQKNICTDCKRSLLESGILSVL